ncbi:hypothetical protein O9X98_04910 [Agrobacterium salinitolerans]|nr:hypothetical protein [Agrobacterium salinitolerans]
MPAIELTLKRVDNENCRVYFTSPGERLYCFQLQRREFEMWECTDEGEPLCHVDISKFEPPFVEGTDSTIRIAREYNEWLGELVLDHGHNPSLSF